MHTEAHAYAARALAGLEREPQTVVELGSCNVNGTPRDLVPAATYVGVDLRPGPAVDVVADGADYRPGFPVDAVLCMECLEHTDHPGAVVANAAAMLRPGGVLVLTCAGPDRGTHGMDGGGLQPGEFYAGISPVDLCGWLADAFGEETFRVEYHPDRGDLYATAVRRMRSAA